MPRLRSIPSGRSGRDSRGPGGRTAGAVRRPDFSRGRRPSPDGSRRSLAGRSAVLRGRRAPRSGARAAAARPRAGFRRRGLAAPSRPAGPGAREGVNLPLRYFGSLPFTPERFHVLLNSLFKVLFNFPSRYLFAIGLVVLFSLRWSLPPAWGCTLKQPDSEERPTRRRRRPPRAWHPLRAVAPFKMDLDAPPRRRLARVLPNTTCPCGRRPRDSVLGSSLFARSYWGNPC